MNIPYEGELEWQSLAYFENPDDVDVAPIFYKRLSAMRALTDYPHHGVWQWRVFEEHSERTFTMTHGTKLVEIGGRRRYRPVAYTGKCLVVTLNLAKELCIIQLVKAREGRVVHEYRDQLLAFALDPDEALGLRGCLQRAVSSALNLRLVVEEEL